MKYILILCIILSLTLLGCNRGLDNSRYECRGEDGIGPSPDFCFAIENTEDYPEFSFYYMGILREESMYEVEDINDVYKSTPFIVPNGIPMQPKLYEAIHQTNSIPQILCLSNYKRSKGILVLIQALGKLKRQGYEFNAIVVRDSFTRRAQQYYNKIITLLRSIGVPEDDIIIELEHVAIKNLPASATWYLDGYRLHYIYKGGTKYVENLFVVAKIIELEVKEIISGNKTVDEFIFDFSRFKNVTYDKWFLSICLFIDAIYFITFLNSKCALRTGFTPDYHCLKSLHFILVIIRFPFLANNSTSGLITSPSA